MLIKNVYVFFVDHTKHGYTFEKASGITVNQEIGILLKSVNETISDILVGSVWGTVTSSRFSRWEIH